MYMPYWLLDIPYLGNVYSLLVIGYALLRQCILPLWLLDIPY